jgi:cell wall-associated NlpC family hydrolase
MRRGLLLVLLAGVAALVAAALSSGEERPATAAKPAAEHAADLPPLPQMRPKVVEPVAGNGGAGSDSAPTTDPGLTDVGPKPTGPASAGATRRGDVGSTDITKATALANGVALPPLEAPAEVRAIFEAGNTIARSPYKWGGGHGKWQDNGYDCSGSVSYALAAAGLLNAPLASGPLMGWGKPGKGKWITIYSNPGHVFMVVAGVRFDTVARGQTGSRWINAMTDTSGYVARHPQGL